MMRLTSRGTDGNDCAQLLRSHLLVLWRTNSLINIHFKSEGSILLEGRSIVPIPIYSEKPLILQVTDTESRIYSPESTRGH